MQHKKQGDFSGLATKYSMYRPGYSRSVLNAILGIVDKPVEEIDFADVGAGTAIWTRMMANAGVKSVTAIEPNDDMREQGIADSRDHNIEWRSGNGEKTGLESSAIDLISMASSFHWVDFDKGTREFARILRPGGCFVALWNPRLIETNKLLVEIEEKLGEYAPDIKRVSSGRSGITETLTDKLVDSPYFDDTVYLEGRHIKKQTPEEYIGVWWSVNDIRAQAGEDAFSKFMEYVESRVSDLEYIETTYLTRAWMSRKTG